jgi:hypothetical protein
MAGFTNRGKYLIAKEFFHAADAMATFFVALVKSSPDADTDTLGQLTEVALGNGYAEGGLEVERSVTGFDTITEEDTPDRAFAQIKDLTWTSGSAGTLPSDGVGATYAVLTTDEVTPADRQVVAYFDLGGARVVSAGQTLKLIDCELRLNES